MRAVKPNLTTPYPYGKVEERNCGPVTANISLRATRSNHARGTPTSADCIPLVENDVVVPCAQFWIQPGRPCERGKADRIRKTVGEALFGEHALSEGPRSMRAVNDNRAAPLLAFEWREEQSTQFWIQPGPPL